MARKRIDLVLPVLLFAGLSGIFLAPWFVPHGTPVHSVSYILGFNNFIATLAFFALLAALFVRFLRTPGRERSVTENLLAAMMSAPGARAAPRSLRIAFGLTTTLTLAILLVWYRLLPFVNFGEFGADVSRLDQMVLGLRPYRDFQYNYGPAMLYPAYWLYQLCGGRLSIDGAFFATVLIHWAAGLSLLYYCVQTLCRGRQATVVFLCVSLAVFNFSMGIGYTPLRFIPPLASLLFLHRTFSWWVHNATTSRLRCTSVATLLSLASLSLSPEIGVATAAGITAFFGALFFTPLRRYSSAALAPVFALGIAVLVFSVKYTEGIFSVGSGANNFPVFPTLAILLQIAAGCLILPRLGLIGVRERNHDGALAIALVVGLGLLIPAAFGRCDQGHVLFNGLGLLLLLLAVAVRLPNGVAVALIVGAVIVVHPILGTLRSNLRDDSFRVALEHRKSLVTTSLERENEKNWYFAAGGSAKITYGKLLPIKFDLLQLLRHDALGTPFYPGEVIDRFLKLSGRFSPEYYAGVNMQVYTPSEVSRKIRDLRTMSTLLVPKDHWRYPVVAHEDDAPYLSGLLFFPSRLIPGSRKKPYLPGLEIVKYITDNFTVAGEFRTFEIWRRNTR